MNIIEKHFLRGILLLDGGDLVVSFRNLLTVSLEIFSEFPQGQSTQSSRRA